MIKHQTTGNQCRVLGLSCALSVLGYVNTGSAVTILYGNNASGSGDYVEKFDASGVKTGMYHPTGGNGRGVVVVGNTIYSTVVSDPHIYKTDATTGLSLGSILTANASMSTIAWDGSYFWTTDYSGSNKGFQIDPLTGANVKTVTFGNASHYMDGMEYFNGKLIVNREDAGYAYDIYDTDGNLLTTSFITTAYRSTGIAYDGTDFFVSDIFNNMIHQYNGITGAEIGTGITLGGPVAPDGYRLIEDLSVDYETRPDTGHGVPDAGSTLGCLGLSSLLLFANKRRLA